MSKSLHVVGVLSTKGSFFQWSAQEWIANLSTRLFVGTGNDVAITGFVISGSGLKRVVIRALGPTLTQYGISAALANPVLELHDASG